MEKNLEDVKDPLAIPGVNDISESEFFLYHILWQFLKRKSVNKSIYIQNRGTLLRILELKNQVRQSWLSKPTLFDPQCQSHHGVKNSKIVGRQ